MSKFENEDHFDDEANEPNLVEKLSKQDPYVVMLSVALAATVLACLVLFSEWWSYGFTTSSQSIKKIINTKTVSTASLHPGTASTTV